MDLFPMELFDILSCNWYAVSSLSLEESRGLAVANKVFFLIEYSNQHRAE